MHWRHASSRFSSSPDDRIKSSNSTATLLAIVCDGADTVARVLESMGLYHSNVGARIVVKQQRVILAAMDTKKQPYASEIGRAHV